jgi:RNA polymerase sigma-70 factor (ECF subfamily)
VAARGHSGQSAGLARVTGRFEAIDAMRRRARFDASQAELAERLEAETVGHMPGEAEDIEEDRLRLIFTCCHPVLPPDAQVALTLREARGLPTEEITQTGGEPCEEIFFRHRSCCW